MNQGALRIAVGGKLRLRKAVEAQVRRAYLEELSKATDPLQKARIEEMIQRKIREEMKRVASPYSLWSSV